MKDEPYEQFAGAELTLRDMLAVDRTILANERTLLAYLRTGLALALTGAGCIRFFDHPAIHAAGAGLIALSGCLAAVGVLRFARLNRRMKAIKTGRDASAE